MSMMGAMRSGYEGWINDCSVCSGSNGGQGRVWLSGFVEQIAFCVRMKGDNSTRMKTDMERDRDLRLFKSSFERTGTKS